MRTPHSKRQRELPCACVQGPAVREVRLRSPQMRDRENLKKSAGGLFWANAACMSENQAL